MGLQAETRWLTRSRSNDRFALAVSRSNSKAPTRARNVAKLSFDAALLSSSKPSDGDENEDDFDARFFAATSAAPNSWTVRSNSASRAYKIVRGNGEERLKKIFTKEWSHSTILAYIFVRWYPSQRAQITANVVAAKIWNVPDAELSVWRVEIIHRPIDFLLHVHVPSHYLQFALMILIVNQVLPVDFAVLWFGIQE